ncbi:mitochondrial inner membrane protein-domain-containing protein [Russula brevipes]|nr:mitochondrial inner membrane protein-domain-containing protein [Russula brevipes]
MFRALPVARQATSKQGRGLVRISRRKKKRLLPRLVFYTTAATTTFYVGSAFVAFNNHPYHSFFQQYVPFAPKILEYGEDHGWDVLTIADVVVNTYDGASGAYLYTKADEVKGRVQKAVDALKTDVKASTDKAYDQGVKAAAIARHQGIQFTQGVEELILEAEAALQGKPFTKSTKPEATHDQPTAASEVESTVLPPKNVYHAPLPLGHEPPPGFTRPAPPKPPKQLAPGEPLPLVAPAVEGLHSSEPVLTHLAGTIDSLASFLNANPAATNKARDVLDSFERLREDEKIKLEQSLDEQTREYTLKLLELELQAQDKLENQESDFRALFEEEKARFSKAYREKLEHELRTQSDIINERLKEEVIAQGIELQRRWIREIKRLERVALDNSTYLDENLRIHALWSALLRVLRHAAAARDDAVVGAALEALEAGNAPDVGVEPLADLASWFTTSVAPAVSRVALVPDDGAGVLAHAASHVLSRTRELNQLRGAAKTLLTDWLEAARRRLEVQQALEVVHAQATLASILVAQGH